MRPFWSAHLSNLIHVFRWRCILPFVGVIADLRFLTSVPESRRAYLPPTQLGCLLVCTPSVPYRTIHSVALSLYPTRYQVIQRWTPNTRGENVSKAFEAEGFWCCSNFDGQVKKILVMERQRRSRVGTAPNCYLASWK